MEKERNGMCKRCDELNERNELLESLLDRNRRSIWSYFSFNASGFFGTDVQELEREARSQGFTKNEIRKAKEMA